MAGRPKGISDDDLLELIQQKCELHGMPVVPTNEISNDDEVPNKRQAVRKQLNRLHEEDRVGRVNVGGKYAWWVPDGEAGEVDFSRVNWSTLPIEEIPIEILSEHPDYHEPTRWDRLERRAQNIAESAFIFLTFGLLIYAFREKLAGWGAPAETAGALSAVAGLFLIGVSLIFFAVHRSGELLADHGAGEAMRVVWESALERIRSKTGYTITRVEQDPEDRERPADSEQ